MPIWPLLALLLLFLVSPHSIADNRTIHERLQGPLVAAHQGGIFELRPNTLEQFRHAINIGVDILEMDLRPTSDGHVVVFHNENLDWVSSCRGPVNKKTLAEIKKCRLTFSGLSIPSFAEVLEMVNGQVVINAEFKEDGTVVPAIREVVNHNALEWVYFQTKADEEVYLAARALNPQVALLFKAKARVDLDWALSLNDPRLVVIELEKNMGTPENLADIHAAGKLASSNSWRFAKMKELGSAGCTKVFRRGIDIAVCNNLQSCVDQKRKITGRLAVN